MVTPTKDHPSNFNLFKIEQPSNGNVQSSRDNPPTLARAIPIENFRSFEEKLQSRGLICSSSLSYGSLWFLIETEKNVFLWRRGLSLSAESEFRFYVDVRALVTKRLQQIRDSKKFGADTPFINPLWSISPPNEDALEFECRYLTTLESIWTKVEEHMLALKLIAELIEAQTKENQAIDRETVVLGA